MARKFLTPIDMGGNKITGAADGTTGTDLVTKQQLDAVSAGLDPKGSVRVASVANVSISSAPASIDGVTLTSGDRVLLKDETAGATNGLYVFNGTGAAMTRTADADTSAEVTGGMYVFVEEGTVNADTGWVLTTNGPITLATTALVFSKFTALAAAGPTVFAASIGDGATTSFAVTHSKGTTDVIVQTFQISDGARVEPDETRTSTNVVTIAFATAPTTNQYRVVVLG